MAIYSYTRVSTSGKGQTTDNQDKLIEDAGFKIDESFSDTGVSGTIPALERPAFKRMMNVLKPLDTCVVVMVDRLGRTASDVLQTVEWFKANNIKLRVIQLDAVDLTSSMGKLVLTMLAAVAEMERNLTVERVKAGLERTKAAGTVLGKPLVHMPSMVATMFNQLNSGVKTADVAHRFGVSERQLYRLKKEYNSPEGLTLYAEKYNMQQLQKERVK